LIKSTRIIWAEHIACIGERRAVGKPEGKRPLGRPGVDEKMILR
jgi:hypothetical protein